MLYRPGNSCTYQLFTSGMKSLSLWAVQKNSELYALLAIQENFNMSVCRLIKEQNTLHRILQNHKFKPYVPTSVHSIEAYNLNQHLEFCRYIIATQKEDQFFLQKKIE